jgi:hypothetical protein
MVPWDKQLYNDRADVGSGLETAFQLTQASLLLRRFGILERFVERLTVREKRLAPSASRRRKQRKLAVDL